MSNNLAAHLCVKMPTLMKKELVYLASEYPAISHTFIFREIQALRNVGFVIDTASVRLPAHLGVMSPGDRSEAENTFYVKAQSWLSILFAHVRLFFRAPHRYISMALHAFRYRFRAPLKWVSAFGYFVEAGILIHWMLKRQRQHVHVHFANPAATVALIASRSGWITFSLSVHGPDVFYNVDKNLLEEKFKRAVFVRCISYYCLSQVQRLLPVDQWAKCSIVRCGIDLAQFLPRPSARLSPPEILCVGRLTPAKGQAVLLNACRLLRDRGVSFHLTLVGDGPDRERLESLAQRLGITDAVHWAGAVGQHEIQSYYERATLFVLPSFAEGLPVVLMEAMAKGVPCVSTRITGIPELIRHGENGLLVAPADVEGLADAIEQLLREPSTRERFSAEGRVTVERAFDLAKNADKLATLFDKFVFSGEANQA